MRVTGLPNRARLATAALATVVFSVATVALFAARAPAAPKPPAPPAPSITSGPTGTVSSTTAAFTYTDSQAGVSFQCSLDGAGFNACAKSGKTYSGLAGGSHSFAVAAQNANSALSPAATRSWTVDVSAPTIVLSFPAGGGSYNAAGWNAGCSPVGVCGTATDPSGVASVQVAVYRGLIPSYATATLQSPGATATTWKLGMALPVDGSYSVRARATDAKANTTSALNELASSFRIDTVSPPPPFFLEAPADPTTQTDARFRFLDLEPDVNYRCSLDQSAFAGCGAEYVAKELSLGRHCLAVRAVDRAGNLSTAAQHCWTIETGRTSFTISGNVTRVLSPGAAATVDLALANPNSFDIRVTSVTVKVEVATTKAGAANAACDGTKNLVVTRQLGADVTLPKKATRSLSQLGVPESQWPLVTMPNLAVNQDACKLTTFTLTYSGTAEMA